MDGDDGVDEEEEGDDVVGDVDGAVDEDEDVVDGVDGVAGSGSLSSLTRSRTSNKC